MTVSAAFVGLEGLLDLAPGKRVDMCASLLRALTDLYLQRPIHTPEDEHYYTELALRLIDATDVSDRAALAARLASYPSAPRPVLERLARDVIEVAGPFLDHPAGLSSAELTAIAAAHGRAHAQNAATRPAAPAVCALDAAKAYELSELFYRAKAPERRLMLINLDYALFIPSQPPSAIQGMDLRRLESAGLKHDRQMVIGELERTLRICRTQALRIVNDELGEPIVVAAKAMDLPGDVSQRLVRCLNPGVGQSTDRMRELAELHGEISMDSACRLIAIWRDAERGENRPGQHEAVVWWVAAENARRALSEVSRRPELHHDIRLRSGAQART
jgi:hypothetical protein